MYREYPKFKPEEVLVYLRKSRSDDPMLSVEEVLARHEGKIKEWIERHLDEPIPPQNYYREVISGESLSNRVEFKKLLRRIESPDIKAVLVVEVERLGRPDLEEIGKIIKFFRYTETWLITLDRPLDPYDLRDADDRDRVERLLMRGADNLDYTKKVLRRGKDISLRGGWYINGVVPYGYEKAWAYEGKRERPTLAIVEDEAKVVRMIFDWYVNENIGATKICQRLNDMGIPSRKGMKWKKSSIHNILKNEHYMGKIVIRKHIDVKMVEDLEITTHCVKNKDYEIVDGRHPAIIDEETFYKAQNRIHRRPSVAPSKTLQNPFASILKCECGRVMVRRKNRNTFRYLCDDQMFCGTASCGEEALIEAVINGLMDHVENLSTQVNRTDEDKVKKHKEHISFLEAKLIEAENKEISLWDKYTDEKMPKKVFDNLLAKNTEEKQKLENALLEAQANEPKQVDYESAIATLHECIKALSDDSVSASVKNKLLLSIVDKIVYSRQKAIRMSSEEAQEKGITLSGGWYCPDFIIDISLKV